MRLEKEVPAADLGNTTIDNCSRRAVGGTIRISLLCGVEAGMVPLSADNDRNLGETLLRSCRRIQLLAGIPYEGKLLVKEKLILAL
jgi:hypothetical protein